MNVRKPIDYSAMFEALDVLMTANLPQMELYHGIGRVVSGRPEKGAAVAAAEYLQGAYLDATGFSPRSLRRMRDFYRTYESAPEIMAEAMTIGWTQNVVIMEAELPLQEKMWYIRAVRQSGWSKSELAKQITASAHLAISLDLPEEVCYTGENSSSVYPSSETQAGGTWHRPHRERSAANPPPNYGKCDLLIGMGQANHRIFVDEVGGKARLLMEYTDRPGDVADPWDTG